MEKYLVTFKNTHDAIKGETVVNKNKIKVKVMPTPTDITKSCGISLEFEGEYLDKMKELVAEKSLEIKALFKIEDKKYILKEF